MKTPNFRICFWKGLYEVNENGHKISIKILHDSIYAKGPKVEATLTVFTVKKCFSVICTHARNQKVQEKYTLNQAFLICYLFSTICLPQFLLLPIIKSVK